MQPFLNLPTLGHNRVDHGHLKVLLQLLYDIQDPQLSSLKVDPLRSRMFEKGLLSEGIDYPGGKFSHILPGDWTSNPASVKYLATIVVSSKS